MPKVEVKPIDFSIKMPTINVKAPTTDNENANAGYKNNISV